MMTIENGNFVINGEKIRILSGAIHYFRIPRERWADSINKAKLMGLNTIETYIAWNIHEPERGEYNFSGMYDICAFLDEIQKAGLFAIVRPGPYICAEWDFGGFPYWLLSNENIRLRCMDTGYIEEVSRWYDKLIPMFVSHTMKNGGSLVAVQVENEYGSYGNDDNYLRWLKNKMQSLGLLDVLYFTSDGPGDNMLQGGTLPDTFKVVNFGSGADVAKEKLEEYQSNAPMMCGEFWDGW
ncbi:MAG: beta-galactosidase, partial [Oscillospiraceae bacterium]